MIGRFSWIDLVLNVLRIGIIALVIIGATNTILSGKYSAGQWVDLVASGLAQGSIYALIALGYTLVYGILLMINFAHGEVYMAGAFTTVFWPKRRHAGVGSMQAGLELSVRCCCGWCWPPLYRPLWQFCWSAWLIDRCVAPPGSCR